MSPFTDVELRQRRKTHSRSPSKQVDMLRSEPKARLMAHFQKLTYFFVLVWELYLLRNIITDWYIPFM